MFFFWDVLNSESFKSIIIFSICKFSEEDEEVFEDNPEEYIRRDIEGSGETKTLKHNPPLNSCTDLC